MSRMSGVKDTFLWDPGSINNNSTAEVNHTVPGVHVGDVVLVAVKGAVQHLAVYGHVEDEDLIDIHLVNHTGGAVDLGEIEVRVKVIPWGAL